MRPLIRWLAWPVLLGLCIAATQFGIEAGHGYLVFNGVYVGLAAALFLLERVQPFEPAWLENCGQMANDLAHTVLGKGTAQVTLAVGTTMGLAELFARSEGGGLWPGHWPMPLQVLLGLVLAEAGLYWAHRLSHEWQWLWRFHAVHHSATRLWFFNTGRFHLVDTAVSILLSQPLLFLAGAPREIFVWVSAITAFIGILTHCNIDLRFGPLSWLFNTPALHRWHHSMDLREGNRNYGENLMLFDLLFGTYYNPGRRPPARIGIREAMPKSFLGQVAAPFRSSIWRA